MNNVLALVVSCLLMSSCMQVARAGNLLEQLFDVKPKVDIKVAPNGTLYIKSIVSEGASNLQVFSAQSLEQQNQIDLTEIFDSNTVLRSVQWLDNRHIAAVLTDKEAVKNTLLERNAQTRLIIVDIKAASDKPLIYEVSTKGNLIESAPDQAGIFYFARNGRKSKVYKISIDKLLKLNQKRSKLTRIDGGQFTANNVVVEAQGYALSWFFEASGEPSAVMYIDKDQKIRLDVFEQIAVSQSEDADKTELDQGLTGREKDRKHKTIKQWSQNIFDKDKQAAKQATPAFLFFPIAKSANNNQFYAINFYEEQSLSLYLVDYENDTHEQIYNSPGLPIQEIVFAKDGTPIGVIVVDEGLYTTHYFDSQPIENKTDLLSLVTHESALAEVKLLFQEAHNKPGQYFLKVGNSPPRLVHSMYPRLPDTLPSTQVTGTVMSGDMQIPYLLTLPKGASSKNKAPLIVLPHGGPFNVFDTPYFDTMAQFFAANHYAVLRVNFRGSGGYGIEHRDAGKRKWGTELIADISKAVDKVQERLDIKASSACTVGMSYGGYASLMLNLQSPQKYKCAVSVAGVTDMNLFLHQPDISDAQARWLREYVGDRLTDKAKLLDISPLYKMANFKTPLLLIHGAKDERVIAEHSYRVKLVLEKANIPFEWRLYQDADHHFAKKGQSSALFDDILQFVNLHLQDD